MGQFLTPPGVALMRARMLSLKARVVRLLDPAPPSPSVASARRLASLDPLHQELCDAIWVRGGVRGTASRIPLCARTEVI